jgi:PAT family beta-lactamase induction signal transducer AmpG
VRRLGDTTGSRLVLFGGLYFAQGVPWGFVTQAMALRLTNLGVPPATLGWVMGLAYVPYMAKPLAAPLVDLAGRRRPLLLAAELAMAVTLVALSGLSPLAAPVLFAAVLLAHNGCAAVQDVATDALALDLLPAQERGRANGVMTAGKYTGMLVGGSGLAQLSAGLGWPAACLAAVVLLLLPAALVLAVVDPPRTTRPALARETVGAFTSRPALLGALFVLLASMSDSFLTPMFIPLLRRQLAYPETFVARLLGLGGLANALGGLLGGRLSDGVGRRHTLACAAATLAACHLAFAAAAPWWGGHAVVLAYVGASGIASGAMYAAVLALCMDLTSRRVAATQFQIYMALINLRMTTASFLGGHAAALLAAPAMLALAAALEVAPLGLLPLLGTQTRREADRPHPKHP